MNPPTAHSARLLPLMLTLVIGCSGERSAEPAERARVIEAATEARSEMVAQKRFLRSGIPGAPEVDRNADIVTGDDGESFFFRSDSIVGRVDSLDAEFLFTLRLRDSVVEGVMRTRKAEGEWEPVGLFLNGEE